MHGVPLHGLHSQPHIPECAKHVLMSPGYIAQWLERLTADQQVPGSNPGVPSTYSCSLHTDDVGHTQWHNVVSVDIAWPEWCAHNCCCLYGEASRDIQCVAAWGAHKGLLRELNPGPLAP